MRSFALIALFSFSAQVHAEVSDEMADKLVEKLANKLVDTMLRKMPAQATSHIQAYSPFNGKKAETLSYLPQLSDGEIERQISYMLRNNWTPGLEFSDDADVYLNTRMGPGYYDNRYWSMYKLPMFGCTDPSAVIREIEACKKEFPHAKVRVIAYDSNRQVQVAGFIVRK